MQDIPLRYLAKSSPRKVSHRAFKAIRQVSGSSLAHIYRINPYEADEVDDTSVMIVMKVRDDHSVKVIHVIPREGRGKAPLKAAIDEDRMGTLANEDGIPLADIENRDARAHKHAGEQYIGADNYRRSRYRSQEGPAGGPRPHDQHKGHGNQGYTLGPRRKANGDTGEGQFSQTSNEPNDDLAERRIQTQYRASEKRQP